MFATYLLGDFQPNSSGSDPLLPKLPPVRLASGFCIRTKNASIAYCRKSTLPRIDNITTDQVFHPVIQLDYSARLLPQELENIPGHNNLQGRQVCNASKLIPSSEFAIRSVKDYREPPPRKTLTFPFRRKNNCST